ncbi:Xenotropic and polytropic retrovirus receptor 1 [Lamellibrachia satsuma]|nr:Xenotropic and polytropic retrovirus receptor 1 [Lamellibrachia satsuma]
MKFAEHLSAHITPEWRKQYIAYETMKEMLYEALEEAPSPEMTDHETIHRYFARFDEMFFQYCDKELLTINTFFSEKLAEANRKFASLQADLEAAKPHQAQRKTNIRTRFPIAIRTVSSEQDMRLRTLHDLKLAFSEFYLGLILLQNYQTLNFTGFRKILKKHDKLLETERGAHWREASVETAPFYNSKRVDHLIKETEGVFTNKLEAGDRQKAMKRLRVPPLGEKQNPWTTFRVGLFSGLFIVIAIVATVAG